MAVSHRGYKGAYENTVKQISDKEQIFEDTHLAGDEPLLLAQNLEGIPVIVGKNRKATIKLLVEKNHPDVVILDDSYQHIKVHHDFDFLLFNGKNPVGNGFITPAGMLRESSRMMKFAHCFVLNDIQGECGIPQIFKKYSIPIISTTYHIRYFIDFISSQTHEGNRFKGKNVFLLSGIGNPNSFETSMKECGLQFVQHYQFSDHHEFSKSEIAHIISVAKDQRIDAIITTEKDFGKLRKLNLDMKQFYFAKLEVTINEMDIFNGIVRKIKKEIGA